MITCVYCNKEINQITYLVIRICASCSEVMEQNISKLMLDKNTIRELSKISAEYIEQSMTKHTCGGPNDLSFSSDCIGCCPDTTQHYRRAADTIIAWTSNYWREKVMKEHI